MASNTLTNTKISVTYSGVLHVNGVELPPTGLEYVYDGAGNKSSLQLGRACNGATVCGTLSATSLSLVNSLSANQLDITSLLNILQPIGSVIFSYSSANPNLRPGWGSTVWAQVSQGRFIVGVGTGNDGTSTKTFSLSNNTGEYSHQLTESEMPSHTHSLMVDGEQFYITNDGNTSGPTTYNRFRAQGPDDRNDGRYCSVLPSTGGSLTHNNTPPGYGLYVWQRTS